VQVSGLMFLSESECSVKSAQPAYPFLATSRGAPIVYIYIYVCVCVCVCVCTPFFRHRYVDKSSE
jgi:hypothetical protein